MTFQQFQEQHPQQTMILQSGKCFTYRYAQHPTAPQTLVLLTGGIGLSDLFYLHFQRFSKDFSVITFDYQPQFAEHQEFAAAVAEVLTRLHCKGWLIGQSLGGIVAQIIAKHHPQVVEGLVLSNTCSLSCEMNEKATAHLMAMLKNVQFFKKLLAVIPFSLYKKITAKVLLKNRPKDFTEEENRLVKGICDILMELMNKPYEAHMIDFLTDLQNHLDHIPADFAYLQNRVLLILSEDDKTFTKDCKQALIEIMPHPTVITNLTGGHLALLIRLENYAALVSNYIQSRSFM